MICGENFDVMNQPEILSGRVNLGLVGSGRDEIFQPERTSDFDPQKHFVIK